MSNSAVSAVRSLPYVSGDHIPGNSQYRLVRPLGAGGYGTVWLAECPALDENYAIKFLTLDSREARSLFMAEMKILAKLKHPNIAPILFCGETADALRAPYFVMEYLDGLDLRTMIHVEKKLVQEKTKGRLFDDNWIINLAIEIFDGLEAAHHVGIIHRDLKPENIFLVSRPNGVGSTPKLLDWGAFGHPGYREVCGDELVYRGTPRYSAPEQFSGKPVSEQTDIYAVGVVLYECLTGRTPFHHIGAEDFQGLAEAHGTESPVPIRSRVPDVLEELAVFVESLLAKEQNDRGRRVRSAAITAQAAGKFLYDLSARLNDTSVITQMRTFRNVEVRGAAGGHGNTVTRADIVISERFQDVNAKTDVDTPLFFFQQLAGDLDPALGPEPEPFIPVTDEQIELAKRLQRDFSGSADVSLERTTTGDRAVSRDEESAPPSAPAPREPSERQRMRQVATRTSSIRVEELPLPATDGRPKRIPTERLIGALAPTPLPDNGAADAPTASVARHLARSENRAVASDLLSPKIAPQLGYGGRRSILERVFIDGWTGPILVTLLVSLGGGALLMRTLRNAEDAERRAATVAPRAPVPLPAPPETAAAPPAIASVAEPAPPVPAPKPSASVSASAAKRVTPPPRPKPASSVKPAGTIDVTSDWLER